MIHCDMALSRSVSPMAKAMAPMVIASVYHSQIDMADMAKIRKPESSCSAVVISVDMRIERFTESINLELERVTIHAHRVFGQTIVNPLRVR